MEARASLMPLTRSVTLPLFPLNKNDIAYVRDKQSVASSTHRGLRARTTHVAQASRSFLGFRFLFRSKFPYVSRIEAPQALLVSMVRISPVFRQFKHLTTVVDITHNNGGSHSSSHNLKLASKALSRAVDLVATTNFTL